MVDSDKTKRKRGPKPEVLRIEGDPDAALEKLLRQQPAKRLPQSKPVEQEEKNKPAK